MAQKVKTEMVRRLKRIEGQTRGVQRMVEDERDCTDILHQLNAINEAVRSASRLLAETYAVECLQMTSKRKSRATIATMMNLITRVPR